VKTNFVQDLKPNDRVVDFFLVQSKEVRSRKGGGEPYLALTLGDRTGRVDAKMWDGVDEIVSTFEQDDVVKVKAVVQLFREQPQLIIHILRTAREDEYHLGDFLPHTKFDIDEMFAELTSTVGGFKNPHLKALLERLLSDEETARRFKKAPAAKSLHHATIGGLLEHVLSLLRLAERVASNYNYLDVELLQTGVVLHDLGKIWELGYERSFYYTSEGQLLGHITMVMQTIDAGCAAIEGFPPRLQTLIKHMVLSHHGRYEFGSPKLPMFPEALALSYIDDMDSKLESMRAAIEGERPAAGEWSRYNPSLERSVLDAPMFLAGEGDKPVSTKTSEPPPPLPAANPAEPTLFGEQLQNAIDKPSRKS